MDKAPQYVMVGFGSSEETLKFLEYLDGLPDELGRKLEVATRTKEGKVKLASFNIRTCYLKSV
jgi:hypothetical protein